MASPSSSVSASQSPASLTSPSGSSFTVNTTPTIVSQEFLPSQVTSAPSPCPPNTLIVQLSTTLVISDYNLFYAPTSIAAFRPTYSTLPDGSLLTPPFRQDLMDANLSLLVIGALVAVFTRNIFVSADYIRRNKVKNKMLFYVLFLSQILAPVALVPMILSYFTDKVSCTLVIILSYLSGTTSFALLITVIHGVKAYKCMNNRRFIPIVLGLLQAGSTTLVLMDLVTTRGVRRLTGDCIRTDTLRYTRYFVILQFVESLFLCCCFIYVCWKSRGSPAARGRISIQLSMDDLPIEFPNDPAGNGQTTRRGWWDYVPDNQTRMRTSRTNHNTTDGMGEKKANIFKSFVSKVTHLTSRNKYMSDSNEKTSKGSNEGREDPFRSVHDVTIPDRRSLTPSLASRFSRIIPRMELFRQVMKDELLYTTFITFNCVMVAVLVIIGVNFKNGLSVSAWIALNWCIISLLAIHSFGRVVHRHEREALLQHSLTYTATTRAPNDLAKQHEQNRRTSLSLPETARGLRITTGNIREPEDPFADTQPLEPNSSLNSDLHYRDSASIIIVPRSPLLHDNLSPPLHEVHSSSFYDDQMLYAHDMRNDFPHSQSSPHDQDFPTSNLATPLVTGSFDDTLQPQEFSRSWLVSSSVPSIYSQSNDHSEST